MAGAATTRRGGHGSDMPQTPAPADASGPCRVVLWHHLGGMLGDPRAGGQRKGPASPGWSGEVKLSWGQHNAELGVDGGVEAGAKVSYRPRAQLQGAFPETTCRSC